MRLRTVLILGAALAAATGCRDRDPADAGVDSGTPPRPDAGPCTATGTEDSAGACGDGVDNDCNGFIDCNDFSCCAHVSCTPDTTCGRRDGGTCTPTGTEDTEAACGDGVDNDCNGFRDCRDFSCSRFCGSESSNRTCIDGTDNDNDGFVDCMDRDCEERVVCAGEATNANCSDGMDNDGDGMPDCMDADCQAEAIVVCNGSMATGVAEGEWAAMVMARCTGGVDDDGNGNTDCGDFSCLWNHPTCDRPPVERSNAACANGVDDDLDGDVDCADTECQQEGIVVCEGSAPADPLPTPDQYGSLTDAECSNGVNEDMALEMGGSFVDCADFSCSQNPDASVCVSENTDATCSDGMDNDGDGRMDCADFDCSRNAFVTVCESSFAACSDGMDNDGNGFADCDDFSCDRPGQPACTGVGMAP